MFGMPALPSFITGRNKSKASATKSSPFSILRGAEPSPPPPPVPTIIARNFFRTDVIEINNNAGRYSLDFDGGKPTDEFEKALFDEAPNQPQPDSTSSPQVKLDIELSSPEALTDWFAANFLSEFPAGKAQEPTSSGGSGLRNEVALKVSSSGGSNLSNGRAAPSPQFEDGRDDDSFSTSSSSEDVIANLQAMNVSTFFLRH